MEQKYIIVRDFFLKEEFPIVFPSEIVHARIGHGFRDSVVSAGFCDLGKEPCTYGKSESLGIDSRPDDIKIILKHYAPTYFAG